MEHFKKIKNYPNYLISDQGRVYSYYTKKFLKPRKKNSGYFQIGLRKNGVRKFYIIHRLVALAFIPNPENKRTVNHIDGCKINNFIHNLEWATQSENVQHSYDNGLQKAIKGSKHYQAKLSEDQVLEIRKLYKTGEYSQRGLGKIFGVYRAAISKIVNRRNWKHI